MRVRTIDDVCRCGWDAWSEPDSHRCVQCSDVCRHRSRIEGDLRALYPQTPAHDAISDAAAARWMADD